MAPRKISGQGVALVLQGVEELLGHIGTHEDPELHIRLPVVLSLLHRWPPAGIPSILRLAPSTPRVTLRNGQWTPQRLPSQGFTLAQSNPHGSSSSSLFQPLDEDTGTL